jgi:hypothetical protein
VRAYEDAALRASLGLKQVGVLKGVLLGVFALSIVALWYLVTLVP